MFLWTGIERLQDYRTPEENNSICPSCGLLTALVSFRDISLLESHALYMLCRTLPRLCSFCKWKWVGHPLLIFCGTFADKRMCLKATSCSVISLIVVDMNDGFGDGFQSSFEERSVQHQMSRPSCGQLYKCPQKSTISLAGAPLCWWWIVSFRLYLGCGWSLSNMYSSPEAPHCDQSNW